MNPINFSSVVTRVGQVFVVSGPKGVFRIIFGEKEFRNYLDSLNGTRITEGGHAVDTAHEIELYFDGNLSEFKTPVDVSEGTPFQRSVWKNLLDIPYGKTATYKEIAESIGNPGATRAVGNAVGANPVPIVIPCHRVLASKGIGGYSGGINIKKDLLMVEGAIS